jgi:hypothetical protein
MSCAREARKLANYITSLRENLHAEESSICFFYRHIGGLFTDIVLQAGLNYNNVVKPRVHKVISEYPHATTVRTFQNVINEYGLDTIINWTHPTKLNRIQSLLDFSKENDIDTCDDLKRFMMPANQRQKFLKINGIGPKTVDYLLILLNCDTVAVDRHIYSFVQLAKVEVKGYEQTKKVVEYAADFLDISRSSLDKCIWRYMSEKNFHHS